MLSGSETLSRRVPKRASKERMREGCGVIRQNTEEHRYALYGN